MIDYKKAVSKIVTKKLKERPTKIKEITKAVVNKVLLVETDRKRKLIVRFQVRKGIKNTYELEGWAFDKCQGVGLPVPKYLILDLSKKTVPLNYCVENFLDGKELDISKLSDKALKSLALALRRINSIKTKGWGLISRKSKRGLYKSWESYLISTCNLGIKTLIKHRILPASKIEEIEKLCTKESSKIKIRSPRLLHGDFNLKNVLFKNGKVSGILDMEACMSGDPLFDVAIFDYYYEKKFDSKKFYRIYGLKSRDVDKIAFYKVIFGLLIIWATKKFRHSGFKLALKRLTLALKEFAVNQKY